MPNKKSQTTRDKQVGVRLNASLTRELTEEGKIMGHKLAGYIRFILENRHKLKLPTK